MKGYPVESFVGRAKSQQKMIDGRSSTFWPKKSTGGNKDTYTNEALRVSHVIHRQTNLVSPIG